MRETSNGARLREEILARSVEKTWEHARPEWSLAHIEFAEEPRTCLCGHYPIIELCYLGNRLNHEEALVGNVCVTRFFDLGSHLVFDGLRRVLLDATRPLNAAATAFAAERGWVTAWEVGFLGNTVRKRQLSSRQEATRVKINTALTARVRRGPREG